MIDERMRVLVADDSETLRMLVTSMLEQAGFEVVAVGSGEAAIEAVRGGGIDVVIIDLGMPGLGGLGAIRDLRSDPAPGGPLPIIVLSGSANEQDLLEAVTLGADDFLPKPFEPDELTRRVRAVAADTRPESGGT